MASNSSSIGRRPAKGLAVLMVILASLAICIEARSVELPEGLNGCQIDSPDRDECIRETLEHSLRVLSVRGAPSLNIPALDPLVRNSTMYEYKRGPLQVTMSAKQTKIYGISMAKIHDVRSDIRADGMSVEIDVYFPRLFMTSAYKADSSYDGVRFQSNGVMNISYAGMKTTQKMSGRFVERDDVVYLQLDRYDVEVKKLEDFKLQATGMFPDPELNQLAVTFANTYWRSMYQSIVPMTRSSWEPLVVREANQFLASIPFETMLYYGNNDN